MISISTAVYPSPVGELSLAIDDKGVLLGLFFGNLYSSPINDYLSKTYSTYSTYSTFHDGMLFNKILSELDAYFEGKLKEFTISVSPKGTEFQQKVWKALQTIPWGKTISYGGLARLVNNPKASRAVGSANGKNPISIVIPCHRVIAGDGGLGGFGGGKDIKAYLLELEGSL